MNRLLLTLTLISCLTVQQAVAFCGFYVAKADAKLFNKSSQVIIARDGDHTVITMANDFQGEVSDFAMVVPVPKVLGKDQIRVVDANLFARLDAYSGPRLVEYFDNNPCEQRYLSFEDAEADFDAGDDFGDDDGFEKRKNRKLGVKIEAKYTVGEYDILILSAKESDGLETWLNQKGYKIPENAKEVLQPYIRTRMKFFVVKVNLDAQKKQGKFQELRPLQIEFNSSKFMLPIRLGMANAESVQDLIIYGFTKTGRIETVNYRTVKVPTNRNIPNFMKTRFGRFYKATFEKAWQNEGKNAVMLEYAWDLDSDNFQKCDPCAGTPPPFADLKNAGVFWATSNSNGGRWGGSDYTGKVFFTRLHVRYSRNKFPQDLMFQATPNRENFQGRYVMTHPAKGDLDCTEGKQYLANLVQRRQLELQELGALTGWETDQFNDYVWLISRMIPDIETDDNLVPVGGPRGGGKGPGGPFPVAALYILAALILLAGFRRYRLAYLAKSNS